jgi:hypothetical protein
MDRFQPTWSPGVHIHSYLPGAAATERVRD